MRHARRWWQAATVITILVLGGGCVDASGREVIARSELVSLTRHRTGGFDSLAIVANPGVKISALLPPSIVRGEQSRISFDAPGRTADSAYFVGAPSASIAGVGAVRGTLVTSACVAEERVCRQVTVPVRIDSRR